MKKRLLIIIICLIITISAINTVSAQDNSENTTIADNNNKNTIKLANNQQNILQEEEKSFNDLNNIIHNDSLPENTIIELDNDYTYQDSDESSISTQGITIDKNITINGKGHILNGAKKSSIFNITNNKHIILKNITFINGAGVNGGAIHVNTGSSIEIKDSTFQNNHASNNGGAIFIDKDTLTSTSTIYNTIFTNNKASNNGGAIYSAFSTLNITLSSFSHDNATDGGGIYVGGVVHITKTIFDYETANYGGAIKLQDDDENYSTIENSTFQNCYSTGDGGAGYIRTSNAVVKNVKFINNTAGDDGGAIYWTGSNGIIYNITCTNNKGISSGTSSSRGGTICLTGNNVTVTKSSFKTSSLPIATDRDSTKVDGGALFLTGNDIIIKETVFDDCEATHGGGAIYIIGNNTHLLDCNYTNTQALVGGAIYISGNNAIVDDSLFRHNNAKGTTQEDGGTGGAIYVDGKKSLISNSDFAYDNAINYGGAIAVWGSDAIITNNTFDNSSTELFYGGSIFVNGFNATISYSNFTRSKSLGDFNRGGAIDIGGNNANIMECNFEDCYAYFGGDIYVNGANAIINRSDFKHTGIYNKKTPYKGGAIYVNGTHTSIVKSNFTDFTSQEYGGAIYVGGTDANISQSNFKDCEVTNHDGGAIYIEGEGTNIEKSNFTSCTATNKQNQARGGAICIQGANTHIKLSNFNDCQSKWGGDIFVFGNLARIEDSTFKNSESNYGGAIYLEAWGAMIKGANITDCGANNDGGAIYVYGGGINIIDSNFDYCIAGGQSSYNGGGALYIFGEYTHISGSKFNYNHVYSNARGGSIYITGVGTIIEGSYFNKSSAKEGGIIFIEGGEVIIDSSTFANSSSTDSGGAISIHGHKATIQKSNFENLNSNVGGAIYVDGASASVLRSSFDNCIANSEGGAIYIEDMGTTVAYSNFTHSKANNGGAILINGINTTITYCNINNNTAKSAGAIKVSGNDSYISNCKISYNRATAGDGGALDIGGERASVLYSFFSFNYSTHPDTRQSSNGGAINWQGGHGSDSIMGTTFVNNTSDGPQGGGAIFWTQGGTIASGGLIKDCVFINNSATRKHGGALNWYRTIDSTIDNCLFINNYASSDGGALYTGDQGGNSRNLTFINCQFYNNTAAKHGGAIANQMAKSYIYNITFDGNTAGYSGGSILMKEGPARDSVIDHCYIYNSFCNQHGDGYGDGGGAIHIHDNNITISNCAIINSTANKTFGGAIAFEKFGNYPCSYGSIINVTIQNVATNSGNGAAIYWSGDYGYMYNVTIFNSSSNSNYNDDANGGAIYISGSNGNFNLINIASSSSNNKNTPVPNQANGGAIYISGSRNTLTNINIDNSQASSLAMNAKGGAIYWSGSYGTLINATISNTLANGEGGAIYWSGSNSQTVENISIKYSQTNVSNSTNSADGGAIHSTNVGKLTNIYIINSIASKDNGDVHGGAIYFTGNELNNVTVLSSRATTDNGDSYGGAVYWKNSNTNGHIYSSLFRENTANLGGALFSDRTTYIDDTTFTGNVARDGGAIYIKTGDSILNNVILELNSAKKGGAIFAQNVHMKITNSCLKNNTAEEKGGAVYRNFTDKYGSTYIQNSEIINNTAFQGSAIYTTKFFDLTNVILLDNQANSNEFIDKHVGVDETGRNYTSAVFIGFDNVLNAIWVEEATITQRCSNVTYWGVNGRNVSNSVPRKSNREVWQKVIIEMFNGNGEKINESEVLTDDDGRAICYFTPKEDETYYFAYTHETDRYYTYLRDTLSNRSLVKIYAYNPLYYNQNQTLLISLTDGAWGDLNGTVTVKFNDTTNTTFLINVTNGIHTIENISCIPIGKYNVTATFNGDHDHTADSDWVVFEVLPYDDLHITKLVNITLDHVNVTDYIKYTINVTNHGPSDGRGVNVTEILSPYLKLIISNASRGSYNYTGGYWYIGDLGVNETVTLTIIAQVIHEGPITNTVWVNGLGNDTNLTNNIDSAHNFTAFNIVDLRIIKQINTTGKIINVTDIIKYTITVYNNGPCNATGVFVGEVLDYHLRLISVNTSAGKYENGTWNIGRLNNGSNATLTIIAQVIYSGNITNNVTVSGYENDTNLTNNYDNVTNLAIAHVDLQIKKEINTMDALVNVTDKIKFTIHIYNEGPANAVGVYVSEILSKHLKLISYNATIGEYDGATWVIGNLDKGIIHNLTIIAEVISAGIISNEVNITGVDNDTNITNNHDNITNITALPIVDLVIIKKVNVTTGFVNVTDIIKFTITVHNNGPCNATKVNVTEKLSSLLKVIPNGINASKGTYNQTTGLWTIDDIPAYSEVVLTITCMVITNGNIANVVVVNSTENDTNTSNNIYNITNITALSIVDLKINKTVNVTAYANVSTIINYTITVYNAGPSNATGVKVSEVLSKYLKLISNSTRYGYYNITDGIWYIGNLANGSAAVLTLICNITGNGSVINNVNVSSNENDINKTDNEYSVTFIALPIVDVSIIKTTNLTSNIINFGDKIKFTITVHNSGPSNATGIYVNETLDTTHLKLISYNTSTGNFSKNTWVIGKLNNQSTATLIIICEVIETGNFSNFVEVFSVENDTNTSNNKYNTTNITSLYLADLEIRKTAVVWGGTNYVLVGGHVQFTINVRNNGPCEARNVTVNEILADNLQFVSNNTWKGYYNVTEGIWHIGNLAKNEFVQLVIVARVIAAGNVSNFVSINSTDNDTNISNNNDTIDNITALPTVNLIINKIVNQSIVVIGDIVEFNITVTNKGLCNATQVNVTEIINDNDFKIIRNYTTVNYYNHTGGYWYIGNLNVNETVNLTIVCEVLRDGIIPNRVEVTSYENDTYPYDNWDIVYVSTIPISDIIITKQSNATNGKVYIYDIIEFNITVHNQGPSNATSVIVAEPLNTQYFRIISNRTTTAAGYDGFTWNIGNLTYNATETLTIICQVIALGNLTNYANVTVYQNDTNASNNEVNITIKSMPIVDLNITKVVDFGNGTVNVGDIVQFTITVRNHGPCDATNVTVIEKLSPLLKLNIDPIIIGGKYNVTTGIWDIGDLPDKGFAQLIIQAKVISNGTISNFVIVTSNETDTNTTNNNDTIDNIIALPIVDLNITKTVNASYINASDNVLFTITVHNNGPSNATKVNVTEILDKNIFRLISNHTGTGYYNLTGGYWYIGNLNANATVNLTLVCQVLIDGTYRNYVNVTSHENDTAPGNNWAEVYITALKLVDIVITKEINITKVNVTDKVKFTINVTNYGPSNATGVFVGENIDTHYLKVLSSNSTVSEFAGNTWVIGNLAAGATETLTIICEVTSIGNITNFVFVNQTEPDKNESNNNATVNFTSLPLVNLTIIKKANITQVHAGELVKFTINVTNYGPSNATDIEIKDILDNRFEFISTNVTWQHYYRVGQTVVWNITELPNATSYAVELIVKVLGNGTIENIIAVKCHENPDGIQNRTNVNSTYLTNLTIVKKANVTNVNVGELVKFTINVINYGPSNATNLNVTDVLDSRFKFISATGNYTKSDQKIIWNIHKLEKGTSYIIELIAHVLANGTIENTVSVNSTENKTGTMNKTTVNATYINNFTITKKANITRVNVGEMVKFTINVTNYGPSNATNVNITDILDSRFIFISTNATANSYTKSDQKIIWHIDKLQKNTSHIIEFVVGVLGNGTIENIVSVNSRENTTGTENKTSINATYLANLTITKKANVTHVNVGEMVKFTITVTNYGPSNATNVNITDILDSRFKFISATENYTRAGQTVIWNIPQLLNGNSQIIELVAHVLGKGTIENIVSVNSRENTTGTENKTRVNATFLAKLTITKKANVTDIHVGELIKFIITVTNYGPSNVTDVNVTDVLDSRFKFVSANGNYTRAGQTIIWNIPELVNNNSRSIELTVKVLGNGTIENIVSVNSKENTTGTSNKTNVNATYLANLTIIKKANITRVNVGEMVKFIITVTNYGPSNATNVNVTDVLDSRFEFVSANETYTRAGQTIIWNIPELLNNTSRSIELTVKVLGKGTIENIVSVNSTENTTGTFNKTTVNATNLVNLTVIKIANVNKTLVGGLINFTITVTNHGPTKATKVLITDNLIDEFDFVTANGNYEKVTPHKIIWSIPDLGSGKSVSVWIQVRVLTNGTFTNLAIVNSTENNTNVLSNESNVTVNPYVNFTIVKYSNVTGQNVSIGDLIKFTIMVTNTGLSNATNVLITDELSPAFEFQSTNREYARNGNVFTWNVSKLDINTSYAIVIIVKAVLNGFYSNVAIVNSTENSNNTSNKTEVTILPAVNLTAVKKANVVNASVGDMVNFTIIITNHGPSDATNVTIIDMLPDGMIYIDSGSNISGVNGSNNKNNVTWIVPKLGNGESVEAWISVMVTQIGILSNVVTVNSTENTTGTSNKTNVTVNSLYTPIDLDCYDIYYGDVEIITVTLPKDATGTVNITVGEMNYNNVPINNGVAKVSVYDLGGGSYRVTAVYGGDGKYLPNSTSGRFTVLPITPTITIEVEDIWVGEVEILNVTVNAPGSVFVTVNGETVEIPLSNGVVTTYVLRASSKLDYDGHATWNIHNLAVGTYAAFAFYAGNENYTSVSAEDVFHVMDKPSTVIVGADDIYVGEDAIINIQVGPDGVVGSVVVEVEGKNYTLSITNGKATLTVSGLKAGLKHVKVWYKGTLLYRPSQNTTTFKVLKVKPPIDIIAPDIEVGEDGKITVSVPDDATGKITIKINGKTYIRKVKNGKAVFIVPGLKVGVHDIEAYYSGDDKYISTETAGNIKVNPVKKPIDYHIVDLEKYSTGNPIIIFLLVILALGVGQFRKFWN